MEENRVHRLVVVDPDDGRPVGIVSTTDLVRALAGNAMEGDMSQRELAHGALPLWTRDAIHS